MKKNKNKHKKDEEIKLINKELKEYKEDKEEIIILNTFKDANYSNDLNDPRDHNFNNNINNTIHNNNNINNLNSNKEIPVNIQYNNQYNKKEKEHEINEVFSLKSKENNKSFKSFNIKEKIPVFNLKSFLESKIIFSETLQHLNFETEEESIKCTILGLLDGLTIKNKELSMKIDLPLDVGNNEEIITTINTYVDNLAQYGKIGVMYNVLKDSLKQIKRFIRDKCYNVSGLKEENKFLLVTPSTVKELDGILSQRKKILDNSCDLLNKSRSELKDNIKTIVDGVSLVECSETTITIDGKEKSKDDIINLYINEDLESLIKQVKDHRKINKVIQEMSVEVENDYDLLNQKIEVFKKDAEILNKYNQTDNVLYY